VEGLDHESLLRHICPCIKLLASIAGINVRSIRFVESGGGKSRGLCYFRSSDSRSK